MGCDISLSELTDDEYLQYLYNKEDPTPEDLESAIRLEHLLGFHRGMLEDLNRQARTALKDGSKLALQKMASHVCEQSDVVPTAIAAVVVQ